MRDTVRRQRKKEGAGEGGREIRKGRKGEMMQQKEMKSKQRKI